MQLLQVAMHELLAMHVIAWAGPRPSQHAVPVHGRLKTAWPGLE